jgi:GNAT superfamily N-acetyltransferase
MADKQQETKAQEVDALELALDKLRNGFPSNHVEATRDGVYFGLRLSRVRRRGADEPLDIDLYSIYVDEALQKQGRGTQLVKDLVCLAWQKRGRGVFIENCITKLSKKLGERLVQEGIAEHGPVYTFERGAFKPKIVPIYPDCYFCKIPK